MKIKFLLSACLLSASAQAAIPYCAGTDVTGRKHEALQQVVNAFAMQNHCEIGSNCILNFDNIKYSIAWSKDCDLSGRRDNSPQGSTFICDDGVCTPYGFNFPRAAYE